MMVASVEYEKFKQIAASYSPNFNVYFSNPEGSSFLLVGTTGANQIAFQVANQADPPPSFAADFPSAIEVNTLSVS